MYLLHISYQNNMAFDVHVSNLSNFYSVEINMLYRKIWTQVKFFIAYNVYI